MSVEPKKIWIVAIFIKMKLISAVFDNEIDAIDYAWKMAEKGRKMIIWEAVEMSLK